MALASGVRQFLHWFVDRWSEYRLRRRGYLRFFALRPPNAFPPHFTDLWQLYRLVRHRRPRVILEFGSGCSTVILAQALYDNAQANGQTAGRVYSVDAERYWANVTRQTIPEHLRPLCEVSHSPLAVVPLAETLAFRHQDVPDVTPDFIYLDGPALTPAVSVSTDPLDLEERFPRRFFMVVDGRHQNVEFLRRRFRRHYRVTRSWVRNNSTFELRAEGR
jgi:hypothetical protein